MIGLVYQRYCCGLFFSAGHEHVHLIRKNRPTWQAGRLNGIGGKVEPGEWPSEGMAREFREETGLLLPPDRWRKFAQIDYCETHAHVFFYAAVARTPQEYDDVATTTDEEVVSLPVSAALERDDLVGHLRIELQVALMVGRPVINFEYARGTPETLWGRSS